LTKNTLTTHEVAEYCQVTPRTVVQWINEGKLNAYRTVGNHSRVVIKDFLDFLHQYKMPVPDKFMLPRRSGKKRILIVDDDQGMMDSIRRFLVREKIYDLELASDGFEAGGKFADFKPDLVILDIKMPGLDGYKVCANIRKDPRNKSIKILFISGDIEDKDMREIRTAGADDYLAKPFKLNDLKTKLQNLFGFNRRVEDADEA